MKKTKSETILVSSKAGFGGRIINWCSLSPQNESEEKEGIPKGMVKAELPIEEGERFVRNNGHKKYKVVDGVITYDENLPEYRGIVEIENAIGELICEMSSNDYKQLKYLRGELSDGEFEEVKAWYNLKISTINELKSELEIVREEEAL